jgi:hypothetical protein
MPKIKFEEYEYPDLSQLQADQARAKLRALPENFSDLIQEISGMAIMQKEHDAQEIERLTRKSADLISVLQAVYLYLDRPSEQDFGKVQMLNAIRFALSRAEEVQNG